MTDKAGEFDVGGVRLILGQILRQLCVLRGKEGLPRFCGQRSVTALRCGTRCERQAKQMRRRLLENRVRLRCGDVEIARL